MILHVLDKIPLPSHLQSQEILNPHSAATAGALTQRKGSPLASVLGMVQGLLNSIQLHSWLLSEFIKPGQSLPGAGISGSEWLAQHPLVQWSINYGIPLLPWSPW